jgi:Alkali metal cation/H+ antiporter Nha1 C terminus
VEHDEFTGTYCRSMASRRHRHLHPFISSDSHHVGVETFHSRPTHLARSAVLRTFWPNRRRRNLYQHPRARRTRNRFRGAAGEPPHRSKHPELCGNPNPLAHRIVSYSLICNSLRSQLISQIVVHGSSIAVFTLGKRLNTLSFTITYTQENGTTQASASAGAAWASRLPRMSIASRKGLERARKGKIGPISAPQDGRPLNIDTFRAGGPISLSAIGQGVTVVTAPEATRRREQRRHEVEDLRPSEEREDRGGQGEETREEKINEGHQAWRQGDSIIVEDEEGEVIKTISSPRQRDHGRANGKTAKEHPKKLEATVEGEAPGIANRLKRMWSGRRGSQDSTAERPRTHDLEAGIPEAGEHLDEQDKGSGSYSQPTARRQSTASVLVVNEDNRRTDHVTDRTERLAREEREQETEVERRRREAVLGLTNDSDDEEPPLHPRDQGIQKATSVSSEADEKERTSSSGSSDADGKEDSGSSGAQLIPPPARHREIRFGDISVGTQSFSLEEGPPSTSRHQKSSSWDHRVRWRSDKS